MDARARKFYGDENYFKKSFPDNKSVGITKGDAWDIIGNIVLIILTLLGG